MKWLFAALFLLISCFATGDNLHQQAISDLPHQGFLKQDHLGFTYVDLDDRYIHQLVQPLLSGGFEEPPYFGPGLHGAHITVIDAEEASEHNLIGRIGDVGCLISFDIKESQMVGNNPIYHILTLESKDLDSIRKVNGLNPSRYPFHITVAIKYLQEAS